MFVGALASQEASEVHAHHSQRQAARAADGRAYRVHRIAASSYAVGTLPFSTRAHVRWHVCEHVTLSAWISRPSQLVFGFRNKNAGACVMCSLSRCLLSSCLSLFPREVASVLLPVCPSLAPSSLFASLYLHARLHCITFTNLRRKHADTEVRTQTYRHRRTGTAYGHKRDADVRTQTYVHSRMVSEFLIFPKENHRFLKIKGPEFGPEC